MAEVLDLVRDQVTLNIELKGFSTDRKNLPKAVLELVSEFGLEESVIYSSFDPRMLVRLHQINPDARVGLLLPPSVLASAVKAFFSPDVNPWSLHPHFRSVTKRFIKKAKKNGNPVFTYTVNQAEDMQKMFELGVAGIFTDVPLLAQQVREEQK